MMKAIIQKYFHAIKAKTAVAFWGRNLSKIKEKIIAALFGLKEMRFIKGFNLRTMCFFLSGLIIGLVFAAVALSAFIYQVGSPAIQAAAAVFDDKAVPAVSGKAEIILREEAASTESGSSAPSAAATVDSSAELSAQATQRSSAEQSAAAAQENPPSADAEEESNTAQAETETDATGTLVLVKTGDEITVAAYTGEDAFRESFYYYQEAIPGETGNIVIVGESTKERFGVFGQLETGDTVEFITPDGKTCTYQVTGIHSMKPKGEPELNSKPDGLALTILIYGGPQNHMLLISCRQSE